MSLQTLERSSPSPQESESDDQGSLSSYEGFVCREGCAVCLTPRPGASIGKHGGSLRIMMHLKKLNKLMRPQDTIRLAVELERSSARLVTRYMIVITTQGVQDTEETVVVGTEQINDMIKVCLVLPLWRNTDIKLDGDGGFSVHSQDKHIVFKPCSVQSMWTALQYLFKATDHARLYNYYDGGLSHTWMTFYKAQLTDDGVALNEWSLQNDIQSFRPDSPIYYDVTGVLDWTQLNSEQETLKRAIVQKLREVMLHCNLEDVTSLQIRRKVEEELKMDLKEYRGFLDQQMLVILGQLEKPSRIHEYLYLGSEWNAANLVELKELEIGYILNITREIDNFYPEAFKYKTVRVFDVPDSELLKHWDDTYKFIKEAKENKSKALVHCKMGVSRSAATVIAYTMKEYGMSLEEAKDHVKKRRNCINPNHGFMSQLKAYEGILRARYNELFGTQARSRISYQSRSSSDPNLRQKLFPDDFELQNSSYEDDDINNDDDHIRIRSGSATLGTSAVDNNEIDEELVDRVTHSLPPEKVEGMKSYLASLPIHEEDDGINIHSCSESGSPFSSPLLTPPDDESGNYSTKLFTEKKKPEEPLESTFDHKRVERAASLPITLRSADKLSSPPPGSNDYFSPTKKSPSLHSTRSSLHEGSLEHLNKLSEVEDVIIDQEEVEEKADAVKTTLIKNVTERIKEIEQLNKPHQTTARPSSAGTKSSNESLSIKNTSIDQGDQKLDEDQRLRITISIDRSPSPSNSRGCDSPNTVYKKAIQRSALLLEQKQNIKEPKRDDELSASAEDLRMSTSSSNKGVQELRGVFDGGQLKRSHSLRNNSTKSYSVKHDTTSSNNDIYNSSQQ